MRYIPAALQTHLNGFELTLVLCLKLTRRDGTVLGYTAHDQDLTVSAVVYRSAVGFDWTALRQSSKLEENRAAIEGLLSSGTGGITESDARLGLYNHALVEAFIVNWADVTMGTIPLKRCRLASLYPHGAGYVAELEPIWAKLFKNELLETFGPDCAADLGDARCTVSTASYAGEISGVTSARVLIDSAFTPPADVTDLIGGRFVLTSDELTWFENRIKGYDAGTKTFTLAVPFPALPITGQTFLAYEGCDKKFATCRDRFSNAVNFRGFPHVPQPDKLKKRLWMGGGFWGGVGP